MVVIRLARAGKRKNPFYHLCVTDKRNPRDGRFIERVGYVNPIARGEATSVSIDLERIDYWISVGAVPSPKVKSIIKKFRSSQLSSSEVEEDVVEAPAEESVDSDEMTADTEPEMSAESSIEETTAEPAEDAEKKDEEVEANTDSSEPKSEEDSK